MTNLSKKLTKSLAVIRLWHGIATLLVANAFILFSTASVKADDLPFKSGIYEHLMLAVGPTGRVTGYYHEEQGEGVVKACTFFLAGDTAARDGKIMTWCSESYHGSIAAVKGGVKLTIKEGRSHPGCGLVLMPEIENGLYLERTSETHWQELRLISAEKAFFHSQTNESSRLDLFVLKGDVVGVVFGNEQWIQTEYLGKNKMTRGWIRNDQAAVLKPPQQ